MLDIGCGIGRWAYNLEPIIKAYDGIDFSEEFVKTAGAHFRDRDGIKFFCMPVTDIDTTKLREKYDIVITTAVSMYINDDDLYKL
jgi:predicted TPR repeat methyltransferase